MRICIYGVASHALTLSARYVVEKILGHRFNRGTLEFDVKWQGYENPKDRTWEPEENMYAMRRRGGWQWLTRQGNGRRRDEGVLRGHWRAAREALQGHQAQGPRRGEERDRHTRKLLEAIEEGALVRRLEPAAGQLGARR